MLCHSCISLIAFIAFVTQLLWASASPHHPLVLDIEVAPSVKTTRLKDLVKRNDSLAANIAIASQFSILVNATLGTPPQNLQLAVDTGSSDTLVIPASISACTNDNTGPCSLGTCDRTKSSSTTVLNSTFNVSYGDSSSASGLYSTDNLVIGSTKVNALQFALAQNVSSNFAGNILGLGYISSEYAASYANLPLRLYVDGTTNVVGFSIWFDDVSGASTGKLALGSVDTNKFSGVLETLPIELNTLSLSYDYATIALTGISATVNGTSSDLGNSSIKAMLDVGNPSIMLPDAIFQQAVKDLGANYNAKTWDVTISKSAFNKNMSLDISFGTTTVQIPVTDLIYSIDDQNWGLLLGNTGTSDSAYNPSTLGLPFLRNLYVVFDYSHNQVSLAPTIRLAGNNITLISPNGVAGLASTANIGTSHGGSSDPSNNTSRTFGSNSSQEGNLTSLGKIRVGLGVGQGVPIFLAAIGIVLLIRRRYRKIRGAVAMGIASKSRPDKYGKFELSGIGRGREVGEKAELSTHAQRHELDSRNVEPVEMLASLPEPQELAAEQSVSGREMC